MVDKQWLIDTYGTVKLNGRDHYLKDGDTWVDLETEEEYRATGFDTEEVLHPGTDEFKAPQTNVGYGQSVVMSDLIKEGGFSEQEDKGTDIYGRTLSEVTNPETENTLANKLYVEGIVAPNAYTTSEDYEAYLAGRTSRALLGKEAEEGVYGSARETLEALSPLDVAKGKMSAIDERQFAAAPWMYKDVMFRSSDRTIDNKALSPFSTAFGTGIDSLQQGFWGVTEMVGEKFDNDYLKALGKNSIEANQYVIDNEPTWVNRVQDVKSVSDFANWASGSLGGSLPYFMLMAGGFVPYVGPVAVTALPLVYAGQTWNDMKGDPSKKSASLALSSGLLMAMFDRLGGSAVLKGLTPKDLGTNKGVKKAIVELAKNKKISALEAGKMIRQSREQEILSVLKEFKKNDIIWKVYADRVARNTVKGIGAEGVTEGLQEATQYGAAYLGSEEGKGEFNLEEFADTLVNATAAGGLLGGGIRGSSTAIKESTPYTTGLRERAWERQKAINLDLEEPIDMHETLNKAAEDNIKEETKVKPKKGGGSETIIESNALDNQDKVDNLVGQHIEKQKAKSTFGRLGEIITDNEWLSTGYNVLSKRLGNAVNSSKTLLAEMDFSGWVSKRNSFGLTLPQLRRTYEGIQHSTLHNASNRLGKILNYKNNHKGRKAAYKKLLEYINASNITVDENNELVIDSSKVSEELKKNSQDIDNILRAIHRVEKEIVFKINKIDKNFSKDPLFSIKDNRLNVDKVEANRSKFINMLKEGYDFTEEEAINEFNKVTRTPDGYDPNTIQNTDFLSRKPMTIKKGLNYHHPFWNEFQEDNNYDSALIRATEVANYLADMESMGFNGQRLNAKILQIDKELRETEGDAFADEYMPEIASTIYNHYKAHRGEYHKISNDKLRATLSNIGSIMALAYMPLAVFASIPEIGLAFAKADKSSVIKAIRKASKQGGQAIVKQLNNIANTDYSTEEYEKGLATLRNRGMLTNEYGAGHVVDAEYGNDRRNWIQREMMPAFYRITGLTSFTSAMRVIRDSIGNDFIGQQLGTLEQAYIKREKNPDYEMTNREARAFTKLKELGVDPFGLVRRLREIEKEVLNDAKSVYKHRKQSEFNDRFKRIVEDIISGRNETGSNKELQIKMTRLANDLNLARGNFVDASLVNPDAGRRPLFYSDGRFRLLTLFQGYLSVFSATIVRPILKDMANNGSPADQINSAAMLLTMIGLGFLGQAIKDEIKYGDKPSWLTDAQYLQRGIQASGIMGQTERIFNLFFPLYHSKGDTLADKAWAEIGPLTSTFDTLSKGIQYASEGKTEEALNKFLKISPGGSITGVRQEIAKTLAGEN